MNLMMSGLDCHGAPIELRERLAFSKESAVELLQWLRQQPGVEGCVLLSTCNRTELYLSGSEEAPWRLLCRGANVPETELEPYFTTRAGTDAAKHLIEVACGLHSQIVGEDQIITQVRTAMEIAQEAKTADPALSALFRRAVTAGKRARTEVHVTRGVPSMGTRCRDVLTRELGELNGKKILVIGNGQMGRLAAELLQQAGAHVQVTLRTYRHGETVVPAGCDTVAYDKRAAAMEGIDALVSATTSPHYTITLEQLASVKQPPKVAVDLAVPRDIDPACAAILRCFDADTLGVGDDACSREELKNMEEIAREELEKFRQWQRRQSAPARPLRFPLFLDLTGKTVVLVGGGTIASRRIGTLRLFGCKIVVISPELKSKADGITWIQRPYRSGDLEGAFMAIAATGDREVNHQVGEEARRLGIPVSVADCEAECNFYFPAICTGEDLVAGVVSSGKEHHKTARAAREIRKVLEGME
ncbi:MAG: glutamyl-tRNA reductase [Clostridiales bacterium]|nr:glutamyl-tRNA reductase [Clostridiales bacterium]